MEEFGSTGAAIGKTEDCGLADSLLPRNVPDASVASLPAIAINFLYSSSRPTTLCCDASCCWVAVGTGA